MFDRPPRRFRRGGFVLGSGRFDRGFGLRAESRVEQAGYDVESATACLPGLGRVRRQPRMGTPPESTLLAFIDRFGSVAVPARTPTLDLDEDQQLRAPHDKVDLDAIRADVACDDAISLGLEEAGGLIFARATQPLAVVRHASPH